MAVPHSARMPNRHLRSCVARSLENDCPIPNNRSYFGDFDLLFGAAPLNLRIVDRAVRYHERQYGDTNISRFATACCCSA